MFVTLGGLLSGWVHLRLPRWELTQTPRDVALLALPIVSLATLAGVRMIAGRTERAGDLILTWLMAFLVGMHAVLLALGVGVLDDTRLAVPVGTGLLFLTLGPALAQLEHGSPLGIRVAGTLGSPEAWKQAHRRLGRRLAMAGLAAIGIAPLSTIGAMAALVLGAPLALAVTIVGAARAAVPDEETEAEPRQSPDGTVTATEDATGSG